MKAWTMMAHFSIIEMVRVVWHSRHLPSTQIREWGHRAGELECLLQWAAFTKTEMSIQQGQDSHRAPSSVAPFNKHLCSVPWICQQQLWWKFRIRTPNELLSCTWTWLHSQRGRKGHISLWNIFSHFPAVKWGAASPAKQGLSLSLSDIKTWPAASSDEGKGFIHTRRGISVAVIKTWAVAEINVPLTQPLKRKKSSTSA